MPSGARVVAVEPSNQMRAQLEAVLPDVEAVDATAEDLPFDDSTFDAVVAGQAFHWFNGDRALAEIHRVLRPALRSGTQPGGGLGMLWNSRDDSVEWVRRLIELTQPYRGSGPKYRDGTWRDAFERTTRFTPLECRRYPYAHDVTADVMVDRMASISWIAVLPDDDRLPLLDQVRHLFDGMPPTFPAPYNTDLWWCRAIN
jgi:SAM-dependent methyltransferase